MVTMVTIGYSAGFFKLYYSGLPTY